MHALTDTDDAIKKLTADDVANSNHLQGESSDTETSTESESNPLSPVTDVQQQKSQMQRQIFKDYLEATQSTLLVSSDNDKQSNIADVRATEKKIIDQVRQYQQELFERALEENVIAVLDTGSGKTLIACLLVRQVLTQELVDRSQAREAKIIFFLANSVHLVQQQARVLANNLIKRPVVFVGDDKAEIWKDQAVWPKIFEDNVPVVCTPAVLQQCLDAALIRMDQISLLIFDEAHHAKKDHPYSRIIRSHYLKLDLEKRPRVFGMTASPVDSKGDINTNIHNLESLLHCKVVTASDPSKLSFVPKPEDVIWNYRRLGPQFETDLCCLLRSKCGSLQDLKKGFVFAKQATSTLGTWCADRAWKYIIGASEHEAAGLVKRFEQSSDYSVLQDTVERESAIRNLQEAVTTAVAHDDGKLHASAAYLSSKVLRLYQELLRIYRTKADTRAIVFVDQRLTAKILNDCFGQLQVPNLRSGLLLGTAQDSTSLKKQERFLDQFRTGAINLIFATSVADEGIDIPQCNLCVRFDLYKSPIQYIQSRGRARMKGSIYAHMIEEGNAMQENNLKYATHTDEYVREYCEKLDPNRLLGKGTKLERMLLRDAGNKSFKTVTGAVCDYGNSLLVLSRFASSLYYLGTVERETYEEEIDEVDMLFRYVVRLPQLSEINVRGARGEWRSNKALAKRSAAWNCCLLLRKKGLLDEALNSPIRKTKPENLNARIAVSEQKSAYEMTVKPAAWEEGLGSVPSRLFLSVIQIDPLKPIHREYSILGLLSRVALVTVPTFTVYLDETTEATVSITSNYRTLIVNAEDAKILTNFTLDGVFADIFNKIYETDSKRLSYWLIPLATVDVPTSSQLCDMVDFEVLSTIRQGRIKWNSGVDVDSIWTNRFICDPRNGMFRYFTGSIVPDASIFDPVPSSVPQISGKSMKNIIDFSDSYWKASKKNFAEALYDPNQPVITAELVTARRNFLEPPSQKDRAHINCLIAPQPLEISRLDPSFAASCFIWPSIIHRLEAYMMSTEAFESLGLLGVPAALALEAFTKTSDGEGEDDEIHGATRRGLGRNYERLEFIGDSLLKMMTTITVFNRTKCDEEGMHCRRMEMISNRRLFDVSTQKRHLYRYARTTSFNRTTWYPENLVLLKGRGARKNPVSVKHPPAHQDLGMKTIADISEAIIGAAFLASRGTVKPFDLGIKAISRLVDSEDHAISTWAEVATMYVAPEWSLKTDDVQANRLAEDVASRMGYRFRHPRLLRSAFTHSSDTQAPVPDLQRLEFLGDAVLDWVSISWLFESNPDRNPQWLTEHKMAMVSNKFLAALAVVLDFDKFLYCSTTKLYADITLYAKRVREAYLDPDVHRDFWTHIDSPPKALSDLVESYIGALLVDSDFNYEEIEKFFHKHVRWFFENIGQYDSFANRHPTTFLYKKITDDFKCRDLHVISSETGHSQIEQEITAGVLIHSQVIAASSGTSARYARVRASQKALAKLSGMDVETFRNTFGCDCKVSGG